MKKSMKALVIGNIITLGVTVFSIGTLWNMSKTVEKLENKVQVLQSEEQVKSVNKVNNNKHNLETPQTTTLSYENKQQNKLTSLVTPAMREQETDLSNIVKKNIKEQHVESDGDNIITLKDDSTILVNKKDNKFLFYPSILGDWNYTFKNIGQLNMGVETYIETTPQIKRGKAMIETNSYYQEDGDLVVEYNDGSWSVINEETNKYVFAPANMGDWDLQLKNKEEFRNVVDTYKELAVKNS